MASSKRMSPNQREAISAISTVTSKQEYITSTGGALNVNASVSISGSSIPITGATTALVVGIVDGSGNQITSFGGGSQYTDGAAPPTHPIGTAIEWSDGSLWQTASTAKPLPVTVISGGGGGTQYTNGSVQATPTGTVALGWDTANVRALLTTSTGALILGAGLALIGKMGIDQTTPGTTNNVSVSASSGAGASILVKDITQFGDGSTSGILAVGLELYRAGSTDYARAQGDTTSGLWVNVKAAAANASTNIAQINGVTPLMGNGVTGTGSQRVTIASDNTAFSVNATLSAETTKVIGTVNVAASQTIAVTNVGTFAVQAVLGAETTKVIGVTRSADGSGNLLTSTASALDVNVKSGSIANTGFIATQTDTFTGPSTLTITLASLASSTVGVGRQSTLVTSNTARSALIACKITMGTTPTINTLIYVYLIRGDGTLNDDNAGASDAGLTIINAPLLGTILCSAATSNVSYYGVFDTKFLGSLGPSFGIAVVNSSGAALNATAGNFTCEYTKIT